jgi:hypothetical protein
VDALFAVYEASSWELWSFMELNAFNGAPRNFVYTAAFYFTMVFFLVVFVQVRVYWNGFCSWLDYCFSNWLAVAEFAGLVVHVQS